MNKTLPPPVVPVTPLTPVERSRAAWEALPEKGLRTDGGWLVFRAPNVVVRPRATIVTPDRSQYAVVWADAWHEALAAAVAGRELRAEWRAPAFG